jgi:hypothetical protein
MVSPIIAMQTTLNYFLLYPSDIQVATCISACLADISTWMSAHNLKLNLDKTDLFFLPGKACLLKDPSQSAKNLGMTLDNTLSFTANIKAVTCSCSFVLYNILRVRLSHPDHRKPVFSMVE